MSSHNDKPQDNEASGQDSPFNAAEKAQRVSLNPNAPHNSTSSQSDPVASNSAQPDDLGGLVDPKIENLSDGT